MSDRLAYAGCLHRFAINEKGYLQISIFTYQSSTERFINAIEKPLIPSTVMVSKQCTVMCSSVTDKGLLVLLRLITSNSSILMLIRLQARPWSCQILHTLAIPSTIHGSLRALASNPFLSLLVTDQPNPLGFYRIDNREVSQRTLELIRCSLSTYLYCCLKDSYYWLMGNEMDANTGRTAIQVKFQFWSQSGLWLVQRTYLVFFRHTITVWHCLRSLWSVSIRNSSFRWSSRIKSKLSTWLTIRFNCERVRSSAIWSSPVAIIESSRLITVESFTNCRWIIWSPVFKPIERSKTNNCISSATEIFNPWRSSNRNRTRRWLLSPTRIKRLWRFSSMISRRSDGNKSCSGKTITRSMPFTWLTSLTFTSFNKNPTLTFTCERFKAQKKKLSIALARL